MTQRSRGYGSSENRWRFAELHSNLARAVDQSGQRFLEVLYPLHSREWCCSRRLLSSMLRVLFKIVELLWRAFAQKFYLASLSLLFLQYMHVRQSEMLGSAPKLKFERSLVLYVGLRRLKIPDVHAACFVAVVMQRIFLILNTVVLICLLRNDFECRRRLRLADRSSLPQLCRSSLHCRRLSLCNINRVV